MDASKQGYNPEYSENAPSLAELSALPGIVILEFGSPWCGHCQAAQVSVQRVLANRQWPHVKIYDGKGKKLGRAFQVKLWPTLILLKDGKEINRIVRPTDVAEVNELLQVIHD